MPWAWWKSNGTNRCAAARRASVARAIALAVVLAPLGACSTISDLFNKDDDSAVIEEPADKLYNEGLYLLNDKQEYKSAAKKFEEVDRQHPYSDWARKSLIMSAFAYYQGGDYDESISAAKTPTGANNVIGRSTASRTIAVMTRVFSMKGCRPSAIAVRVARWSARTGVRAQHTIRSREPVLRRRNRASRYR